MEGLLQLLAAHAGIALLDFAQQAFLGGEQNSLSIGVDGAAFEDQPALVPSGKGIAGCHSARSSTSFTWLGT